MSKVVLAVLGDWRGSWAEIQTWCHKKGLRSASRTPRSTPPQWVAWVTSRACTW